MIYNDLLYLRDCIAFRLDNDSQLDEEDVNNLRTINDNLYKLLENDWCTQVNLLGESSGLMII